MHPAEPMIECPGFWEKLAPLPMIGMQRQFLRLTWRERFKLRRPFGGWRLELDAEYRARINKLLNEGKTMKHEPMKSPAALAAFAALKDPSAPEWRLEQKFNEETGLWECPGLKYLPLHRSGPAYGMPRLVFWALAALALVWACRGQIGLEIAQAAKILGLAGTLGG